MSGPKDDVIKKALTDPKFKADLLKDPKAAIEKATGLKIPAGVALEVVEDGASVVHLVLPAAKAAALSDADLGKVSGGASSPSTMAQCQDNTQYWPPGCKMLP